MDEIRDTPPFTPGPWFAGRFVPSDEDEDFGTVSVGPYDLSDRPNKSSHYEDTIAEVWQNPNLAEEAVDNARLIAAAPELFEACEGVLARFEAGENLSSLEAEWLRAALAKAAPTQRKV